MRFHSWLKKSLRSWLLLLLFVASLAGPSWSGIASTALAETGNAVIAPLRIGAMPGPDTTSTFVPNVLTAPQLNENSTSGAWAAQAGDAATKWSLADMYAGEEAWQADCDRLEQVLIPGLQQYQGRLDDPATVRKCLQAAEAMFRTADKVYNYATLAADLDQSDDAALERKSQAVSVYTRVLSASSFMDPELLAQDPAYLDSLASQPGLGLYAFYFKNLRLRQDHYLSAPEEALLASVMELTAAPENIFTKLTTVDIDFGNVVLPDQEETTVSEASYMTLISDPRRAVRQEAYQKLMSGYMDNSYTLAATLEAQVKGNIFYARARKYDSALDAALDSELLPRQVYDNLLDTASRNLAPLHRYTRLRARLLDLDKVAAFDLMAPLTPDYNRSFDYAQAQQIVLKGLAPLGSDYTDRLQYGLNHRWVDVYPAAFKISGAYATAIYDSHPYILLNYDGSYDSVLTLAHEAGHAMYFDYTNRTQPYMNAGTPIVTQEVASTLNEMLVTDYLLSQAGSDEERLYLLNLEADQIVGTFYRQLMYAEFEQQIHERVEQGEGLSPESMNAIWSALLQKYYGPSFVVDDYSACGWMRIPHFYYDFYVYKYALDLAAAQNLFSGLQSGDETRVTAYLDFLKAGSSDYPVNVLKQAGVDLNDPSMESALLDRFESVLDEIEAILVKQGQLP